MSLIEARGLRRDFVVPKRTTFERTRRQTALEPTDLDVVEGSSVGIIGESGSGKSTLALALLGLQPFEGDVRLGDKSCGRGAASNNALRQ